MLVAYAVLTPVAGCLDVCTSLVRFILFFTRYGYGYCYSVTKAKERCNKINPKIKAATDQPWNFLVFSCTKRISTREVPDLKFRWDQPAGPVLIRISEPHSAIFPPNRLIIDPLIPERWLTSPPSPNYSHFPNPHFRKFGTGIGQGSWHPRCCGSWSPHDPPVPRQGNTWTLGVRPLNPILAFLDDWCRLTHQTFNHVW